MTNKRTGKVTVVAAGLNRVEVKRYMAQAAEVGNFKMVALMMSYLDEIIAVDGYLDEDEKYKVKLIKQWMREQVQVKA